MRLEAAQSQPEDGGTGWELTECLGVASSLRSADPIRNPIESIQLQPNERSARLVVCGGCYFCCCSGIVKDDLGEKVKMESGRVDVVCFCKDGNRNSIWLPLPASRSVPEGGVQVWFDSLRGR